MLQTTEISKSTGRFKTPPLHLQIEHPDLAVTQKKNKKKKTFLLNYNPKHQTSLSAKQSVHVRAAPLSLRQIDVGRKSGECEKKTD